MEKLFLFLVIVWCHKSAITLCNSQYILKVFEYLGTLCYLFLMKYQEKYFLVSSSQNHERDMEFEYNFVQDAMKVVFIDTFFVVNNEKLKYILFTLYL